VLVRREKYFLFDGGVMLCISRVDRVCAAIVEVRAVWPMVCVVSVCGRSS
jgi:hypothetical protein